MVVVEFDAPSGLARCADAGGAIRDVETGLLDTVVPGVRLIVHAGTAIGRLGPPRSSA